MRSERQALQLIQALDWLIGLTHDDPCAYPLASVAFGECRVDLKWIHHKIQTHEVAVRMPSGRTLTYQSDCLADLAAYVWGMFRTD